MAENRTITTNLKGRDEVFQMLALAEATQMPLLLQAEPGVGKTNAVLDYEKAKIGEQDQSEEEERVKENSFILEVDEGTRTTAVKGQPNMEELTVNKRFVKDTPIVDADVILINEIDKAGAELRNSLLSIMNERKIYDGSVSKDCNWSLFCGTCNSIPQEEVGNPFWDRFVLKYNLDRLQKDQLARQLKKGINEPKNIKINIPSNEDIQNSQISADKLEKFVHVCHDKLTDRSISYVPTLVKASIYVFDQSESKAFVKVAQLLCGHSKGKELSKKIEPKEVTDIRTRIENLPSINDEEELSKESENIKDLIMGLKDKEHVDASTIEELKGEAQQSLESNQMFQASSKMEAQDAAGHQDPDQAEDLPRSSDG